ncbi:uncharacterized protein LOC123714178 [Pieris brassicae]|uniref:Uncharacterized protein n=1 Tax=Pieris brassicae TaxID=7116 RepID=A0A9P0X370_PIEBR|nr:uncharacterized protein LOC123714178 [Pieris brassicae]CAH3967865.1 unnamed protein product [Pieris brassicae]
MKVLALLVVCVLEIRAYPYPYHGPNVDSYSYGSMDRNRGGMVVSRYYNPYYNPRTVGGGGMAAFMFKPEEYQPQASQYYMPDRRRQTPQDINYAPPLQNEVYYQTPEVPSEPERTYVPESPFVPSEQPVATEATEMADPTERIEVPTTAKEVAVPEITEPEAEDIPEPAPKKRVTKKKQVKKPDEDEEEGDDYPPRMPTGAFFPMFFGYGGRSGQGTPQGATAIANAFSTGRGGVATSHATAYGPPRTESKL